MRSSVPAHASDSDSLAVRNKANFKLDDPLLTVRMRPVRLPPAGAADAIATNPLPRHTMRACRHIASQSSSSQVWHGMQQVTDQKVMVMLPHVKDSLTLAPVRAVGCHISHISGGTHSLCQGNGLKR